MLSATKHSCVIESNTKQILRCAQDDMVGCFQQPASLYFLSLSFTPFLIQFIIHNYI